MNAVKKKVTLISTNKAGCFGTHLSSQLPERFKYKDCASDKPEGWGNVRSYLEK
jgi:hypothetical protein